MSALHFLAIVLANFLYIAGKAAQQLNVIHSYYRLVPVTTFLLAACECIIIGNIAVEAVTGSWLGLVLTVAAMTLGGSTGAMTSMRLHEWLRKRLR